MNGERIVISDRPEAPPRPCCDLSFETRCRECNGHICPDHTRTCSQCAHILCVDCVAPTLFPNFVKCRYGCHPGINEMKQLKKLLSRTVDEVDLIDDRLAVFLRRAHKILLARAKKLGIG